MEKLTPHQSGEEEKKEPRAGGIMFEALKKALDEKKKTEEEFSKELGEKKDTKPKSLGAAAPEDFKTIKKEKSKKDKKTKSEKSEKTEPKKTKKTESKKDKFAHIGEVLKNVEKEGAFAEKPQDISGAGKNKEQTQNLEKPFHKKHSKERGHSFISKEIDRLGKELIAAKKVLRAAKTETEKLELQKKENFFREELEKAKSARDRMKTKKVQKFEEAKPIEETETIKEYKSINNARVEKEIIKKETQIEEKPLIEVVSPVGLKGAVFTDEERRTLKGEPVKTGKDAVTEHIISAVPEKEVKIEIILSPVGGAEKIFSDEERKEVKSELEKMRAKTGETEKNAFISIEESVKNLEASRTAYAGAYKDYLKAFGGTKKEKNLTHKTAVKNLKEFFVKESNGFEAGFGSEDNKKRLKEQFIKNITERGIFFTSEDIIRADKIFETEFAKFAYEKSKKEYGKSLYGNKKSEFQSQGKNGNELESELKKYSASEIFKKLVIEENEILNKAKIEEFPPKEKNIFQKFLSGWARLPKAARWAVSASIATGVAVGGGYVAGGTAALLFGGYRFGRAALSTVLTLGAERLSALGIKGLEKTLWKEKTFGYRMGKLSERFDALSNLEELNREYLRIYEDDLKRQRKINLAKWAVSAAVGGVGSGLLSGQIAGGMGMSADKYIPVAKYMGITEEQMKQFGKAGIIEKTDEIIFQKSFGIPAELEKAMLITEKNNSFWRAVYGQLDYKIHHNFEFASNLGIKPEDLANQDKIKMILNKETLKLLVKNGIIDQDAGTELRISEPGARVILDGDEIKFDKSKIYSWLPEDNDGDGANKVAPQIAPSVEVEAKLVITKEPAEINPAIIPQDVENQNISVYQSASISEGIKNWAENSTGIDIKKSSWIDFFINNKENTVDKVMSRDFIGHEDSVVGYVVKPEHGSPQWWEINEKEKFQSEIEKMLKKYPDADRIKFKNMPIGDFLKKQMFDSFVYDKNIDGKIIELASQINGGKIRTEEFADYYASHWNNKVDTELIKNFNTNFKDINGSDAIKKAEAIANIKTVFQRLKTV
ncbi:MAG: hypothetical protein QMD86_00770 [Patescibacteria group bacterium]|nr:hypothetical protein [Patescibacteria group bacterium]